jgi:AraC family transcriptional regulator of adaptative response/methylated-DNA-[protein]-cysteine methyltransferase
MIAAATDRHLVLLEFHDRRMMRTQFRRVAKAESCNFAQGENAVLAKVREQLDEFFAGRRTRFDVPMHTPGTEFQSRVWRELLRIPSGVTKSYADVARAVGQSTAVRAVARANGDNRIAIIIPCHRVIGSDGSLTGYGGGLWRKQRLLELEAATA